MWVETPSPVLSHLWCTATARELLYHYSLLQCSKIKGILYGNLLYVCGRGGSGKGKLYEDYKVITVIKSIKGRDYRDYKKLRPSKQVAQWEQPSEKVVKWAWVVKWLCVKVSCGEMSWYCKSWLFCKSFTFFSLRITGPCFGQLYVQRLSNKTSVIFASSFLYFQTCHMNSHVNTCERVIMTSWYI